MLSAYTQKIYCAEKGQMGGDSRHPPDLYRGGHPVRKNIIERVIGESVGSSNQGVS